MRKLVIAAAFALLAAPVMAQAPAPAPHAHALVEFPAKGGAKLTVTAPAFKTGGDILFENTQYRGNVFPGLAWSAGPAGTKSYAVIMQDTDLIMRDSYPILHWTLWNIPANVTKLDAGMAPTGNPAGSAYGPNVRGAAQPYMGPRTPPGPKHTYHFQVFALDTTLPLVASSNYVSLTSAMKDHVLASGEVVGLGSVDPTAPPPAPRPAPAPAAAPAQ
ncbi:MAG: carboxylesterase [Caulobacteraceae bacterium]|nr:carboxylesterase [Caulobacteraceae bacterium]